MTEVLSVGIISSKHPQVNTGSITASARSQELSVLTQLQEFHPLRLVTHSACNNCDFRDQIAAFGGYSSKPHSNTYYIVNHIHTAYMTYLRI